MIHREALFTVTAPRSQRRSPWTGGETQTAGAAQWQTRVAVAGASDSAFARGQENRHEPFGQQRQPEEDRLIRRVPQRRSDRLPAGIDGAGATQGAGARV